MQILETEHQFENEKTTYDTTHDSDLRRSNLCLNFSFETFSLVTIIINLFGSQTWMKCNRDILVFDNVSNWIRNIQTSQKMAPIIVECTPPSLWICRWVSLNCVQTLIREHWYLRRIRSYPLSAVAYGFLWLHWILYLSVKPGIYKSYDEKKQSFLVQTWDRLLHSDWQLVNRHVSYVHQVLHFTIISMKYTRFNRFSTEQH